MNKSLNLDTIMTIEFTLFVCKFELNIFKIPPEIFTVIVDHVHNYLFVRTKKNWVSKKKKPGSQFSS